MGNEFPFVSLGYKASWVRTYTSSTLSLDLSRVYPPTQKVTILVVVNTVDSQVQCLPFWLHGRLRGSTGQWLLSAPLDPCSQEYCSKGIGN